MTADVICANLLTMISHKIGQIRADIRNICLRNRREPDSVTLIAVTKYTDVDTVQEAVTAGVTDIGENRVQDAKQKFFELGQKGLKFKRHMIGHLQTNKVKDAVAVFDMIQSVDSLKVAAEINKQAEKIGRVMDILVQVNSSQEQQKSGADPDGLLKLIEQVSEFKHLNVQGLMTIGRLTDDQAEIARCFQLTRAFFDEIKEKFCHQTNVDMKYLSMGMSQDYQIALEHGANMLRIGSAIFS